MATKLIEPCAFRGRECLCTYPLCASGCIQTEGFPHYVGASGDCQREKI